MCSWDDILMHHSSLLTLVWRVIYMHKCIYQKSRQSRYLDTSLYPDNLVAWEPKHLDKWGSTVHALIPVISRLYWAGRWDGNFNRGLGISELVVLQNTSKWLLFSLHALLVHPPERGYHFSFSHQHFMIFSYSLKQVEVYMRVQMKTESDFKPLTHLVS